MKKGSNPGSQRGEEDSKNSEGDDYLKEGGSQEGSEPPKLPSHRSKTGMAHQVTHQPRPGVFGDSRKKS
eukprot:CAMPEP_0170509326 /NCGR_PEP_ID=MMETSP0208-20121228/65130_1 /TAXON_ID=197538 /ORGANISM="Strombidium inclinatum, Strain S3" /LENGTH=68 /DNA_ID=CAMNT_0010792669 /DNA_START=2428 /DNA_END=2634 /DNA_ORIENTATION=-